MDDLPFRPGSTANQYVIQRFLGPGTLGPAYQAFDTSANRSVELRVIEDSPSYPATGERVRMAVERLVRLRHPHILPVLNFGDYEGVFYVITENVRGTSLAERLANDPPQGEAALRILTAVGEAIDFIHEEGLVHGELLPESILLGREGHAYVADAGIAPRLSSSPERYTADRDRRYLAALAYHLLTGSEPGSGRNLQPASRINPQLGPATDAVLFRGLTAGPGSGWPNCDQFVQALTDALRRDLGKPWGKAKEEPKPSGSPWRVLYGLVALLLLAALAFLAWQLLNRPASPSVALSSGTVQAGSSVIVTASHLPAGQSGTVELQSNPLQIGVFQADQYGNLTQSVTIPPDVGEGDHLISLCWNGSCPASASVHVQAPSPSPTPPPTPTPTPIPTPTPTPTPVPTSVPTSVPTTIPTPTPTHHPRITPPPPNQIPGQSPNPNSGAANTQPQARPARAGLGQPY